ncbi:bifunctional tetrahydrofolate synthase/dihydrofolate synthase [Panacagrimonas sp.]|uniref:bifunctional tetrahydrofolate synthase/dihydrofolate synthase n=1 Tax=Panacagrimonas sp. TaxID=2480088 RepID=UPI003B51F5B3
MNGAAPPGPSATLDHWLAYQERLHPSAIELGLDRVGAVWRRLDLHRHAPPTLIVAGTNGKGSSAHLADLILRESGYCTGLYTSPHLLHYAERVSIDGNPVSDRELCAAFEQIEAARDDIALTYFEFGTLAALWCFRARRVQARVLEVGLGGRLDAVNLVDADAALLTSIGLDHQDWLGPDRESIGREKAHVFRGGRPAVCAEPLPPQSVLAHAQAIGAELHCIGTDFEVVDTADDWTWQGGGRQLRALPRPGIPGAAQLRNAGGVITALLAMRTELQIPEAAIRRALPRLELPGRFQRRGRVVFDVAHNAEAAQVLAALIRQHLMPARVVLVLGMLADKPVEAYCGALRENVAGAYCIDLPSPRACPAGSLAARVTACGIPAQASGGIGEAMAAAQADAGERGWVLVSGSFFTVAAGLAHG